MKDMNNNYKDIINSFLLNKLLHHVDMSCIIETNEQLKYDMEKNNTDWITGGPWYNTSICEKHGTLFEIYIINAINDRYNLMRSIDTNGKNKPSYVDDGSRGRSNVLP